MVQSRFLDQYRWLHTIPVAKRFLCGHIGLVQNALYLLGFKKVDDDLFRINQDAADLFRFGLGSLRMHIPFRAYLGVCLLFNFEQVVRFRQGPQVPKWTRAVQ